MVRLNRRAVIALAGSLCLTTRPARAEQWVEVADDAGSPIPNLRVPSELDPFRLPGLLWFGASEAEVHLFEFADYNCPVCKQAALHVDALVRGVQGLRVAFVHNPILSSQSREAARVTLAALRIAGPKVAYALHMRLFAMRGVVDGARALAAAARQMEEEMLPAPLRAPPRLQPQQLQSRQRRHHRRRAPSPSTQRPRTCRMLRAR